VDRLGFTGAIARTGIPAPFPAGQRGLGARTQS
jgi:hypothetical protein